MNWKSFSILLILLTALLLYGPSALFDYNLDDNYVIENLPSPKDGLKGVFSVFNTRFDYESYRPVPTFTVALEQYITGTANPSISHGVNVLLFMLASLLGFLVLMKLPVENILPKALFISLLFVCHPIHSNVVCSIKNRDVLMSFMFGMLSLYYFIQYLSCGQRKHWKLVLVILSLLIAILCKPDAFGFILVLPMVYVLFYPSESWRKTVGRAFALMLGLGVFLGFVTLMIQSWVPIRELNIGSEVLFTENPIVDSSGLSNSIGAVFTTLFYYLKFHLIPSGYYFYFGYDMISLDHPMNWKNLVALVVVLGMTISVFYFWKKDKLLVFGLLFFAATIALALNILSAVGGIVAPRLAFIASFGFCVVAILAIHHLLLRFTEKPEQLKEYLAIACLPIFVLCGVFTQQRNTAWNNMETLLTADMPSLTRSFHAQRIALAHYSKMAQQEPLPEHRQQYFQKALNHAELAHELYSDHIYIEEGMGVVLYYLGERERAKAQLLMTTENFDEALQSFEILGDIYFYDGDFHNAARYFQMHVEREPRYNDAHYKLTNSLILNDELEVSIAINQQLIADYPDDYIGYDNLGFSYLLSGDTIRSTPYFIEAIERGLEDDAIMYLLQEYYLRKNMQAEWLDMIKEVNPENR